MSTLQRHAPIAFGAFQLDSDSGELRRRGVRIKLQSQPFRVLLTLLAKPGEVVTREELQHAIWGVNTSVDFERGLASAINKLREALGDSAESPTYVETLAKRGYRFIAPVIVEPTSEPLVETPPVSGRAEPPSLVAPVMAPAPLSAQSAIAVSASPQNLTAEHTLSFRRGTVITFLAFALALLGLSAFLAFRTLHPPRSIRATQIEQLTASGEIIAGLPDAENLPVMVTDGPRIYASAFSGDRVGIASMELSVARMQPVGIPAELSPASIAGLSQDGSKLLIRSGRSRESEQSLWIVPTGGSSALRVGEIVAHDATWMPDGKSVLYAAGDEFGVAQLDTGTTTILAKLPGRAFWPRWSPDGRLLRFTQVDPATHASSLWELESSTRHLRRLQFPELSGHTLCCGSWTADGNTYVFESSSAQGSNIWAIGADANRGLTELTNGPLRFISPLTARDGRTIYFIGLDQPADVRLYDQKSQVFVPAPPFLRQAQRITYSRDGTWVAWTDRESRLWRARSADGSERLRLTPDDLEVFLAQWSPDNTHLVLMARKPGETWQIYTVSAEGGVARLLLTDKRNLADPDWSADGRQLVFGPEADMMGKENGSHDIEILELAHHDVRKLQGSENLFSPRWSPDGRWIAALSMDQTQLVLYDVQHHSWRTLFNGSAADPTWSSDSKWIYFHAFAEPGSPILRTSLDGHSAPVADLTKLGLHAGDNYFFSGVTPSGSPLIKPSIGTGNLYSVRLSQ